MNSQHIYTTQIFSDDSGNKYSVEALWELSKNAPVEVVTVASLSRQLRCDVWSEQGRQGYGCLTPLDVLANPVAYPDHARRISTADMSFPILIDDTRSFVIDGMHRLTRASRDGAELIKARVLTSEMMSAAVR